MAVSTDEENFVMMEQLGLEKTIFFLHLFRALYVTCILEQCDEQKCQSNPEKNSVEMIILLFILWEDEILPSVIWLSLETVITLSTDESSPFYCLTTNVSDPVNWETSTY